jgi:hypothetical protein
MRGVVERGNTAVVTWTQTVNDHVAGRDRQRYLFGRVIRSTPDRARHSERVFEDLCPVPAGGGAPAHVTDVSGSTTMRQLVLQRAVKQRRLVVLCCLDTGNTVSPKPGGRRCPGRQRGSTLK